MVFPIFPGSANHYDTLFGGQAMAWMDQAAFICATRFCRKKVVTAHIGEMNFHHPIPVGTIVELVAHTVKIGRTSMVVHVDLWFEPMDRPERKLACQGDFVMVAVDQHNQPVSIAPPPPTSDKIPALAVEAKSAIDPDQAVYNIKAVSQLVQVPIATLRAWERRYQFPHVKRTPSGHRRYTLQDINSLHWIKARITEGMQTQQAIQALRAMEVAHEHKES